MDYDAAIAAYVANAREKAASGEAHVAAWGRLEEALGEPFLRWMQAEEARYTQPDLLAGALHLFMAASTASLIVAHVDDRDSALRITDNWAGYCSRMLKRFVDEAMEAKAQLRGSTNGKAV